MTQRDTIEDINWEIVMDIYRHQILDVLLDGQLRISENVEAIQDEVYNMGAVPLIEEKTKRQVKLTEKGKEYKMVLLENRRSQLVSRVIRKSSEIDDLMYSFQNGIAVKEELQQLNDV